MKEILHSIFKVITAVVAIILICKCDTYVHPTVPYRNVDFYIYPNSPNYAPLQHYGGYMYLTGGVSGLIVYRVDQVNFKVYDRACPYDWEKPDSWLKVDASGIIITDSCCGSRFNILDGTVISGPASIPLKYYRATFDGMRLHVYN